MKIRPKGLKLLTSSRLKTFRRCPRLHYLTYDLGWRSTDESDALRFGQLMHEALEAWFVEHIADPHVRDEHWRRIWARAGTAMEGDAIAQWDPDPLECALQAIATAEADPMLKVRAHASIVAYNARWAAEMNKIRVVAVECEFTVPLMNPATGAASRTWALAGKIDVLVEDLETKSYRPFEHKTTSKDITDGSRYWKRLRLDGQLSVYIRGARVELDEFVDRATYDVIKRPGERPGKATPEADRQYTKAKFKQCPECKRKKNPIGPPHKIAVEAEEGQPARELECQEDPNGAGGPRVICTDAGGKLYANMRDRDETQVEFLARVSAAIAADPGAYFVRDTVVRSDDDIDAHAADTWAQAELMHAASKDGGRLAVRNTDACDGEDGPCDFLDVCYFGMHVLNDAARFRRVESVHEELSNLREAPMSIATEEETPNV